MQKSGVEMAFKYGPGDRVVQARAGIAFRNLPQAGQYPVAEADQKGIGLRAAPTLFESVDRAPDVNAHAVRLL